MHKTLPLKKAHAIKVIAGVKRAFFQNISHWPRKMSMHAPVRVFLNAVQMQSIPDFILLVVVFPGEGDVGEF